MGVRPRLLVVAGHDPSGAGVEADREACAGLALDAEFVVTARTEQDEQRVRSIGERDPRAWLAEALEHARAPVAALKFGLLPGAEHVRAAADLVRAVRERWGQSTPVVVDPVLAASSGGRFLDAGAVDALRRELFALGVIATPNLDEAAELARFPLESLRNSPEERLAVARALCALGLAGVVVKGGHGREDPARDLVLAAGGTPEWLEHPRIEGAKIRGSGCRFATRLAARLALGASLAAAARDAAGHVGAALSAAARKTLPSPSGTLSFPPHETRL